VKQAEECQPAGRMRQHRSSKGLLPPRVAPDQLLQSRRIRPDQGNTIRKPLTPEPRRTSRVARRYMQPPPGEAHREASSLRKWQGAASDLR